MAHPLTLVLLGPKWEKASDIFAGFTFASLQYPLSCCATWLFISQGRGQDSFRASLIVAVVVAASFVVGLPFGPFGVALAYSASCLLIQMPVVYWLAGRSGPVSTLDLWLGFFRQLPVWGIVCAVTWLVRRLISDDPAFQGIICRGSAWSPCWSRLHFRLSASAPGRCEPAYHCA